MFSSTFTLAAIFFAFIGLVAASPLAARSSFCNPNFEGAGITVKQSSLQWYWDGSSVATSS
jgi:hypothetical protein